MTRKQMLIVQFKSEQPGLSVESFQDLEEVLYGALKRNHSGAVDGNDIGSGTMNIYIVTESWRRAMQVILAHLKHRNIADKVVIAKRDQKDRYVVLWPEGYQETFSEM
jgi:hypothetical protein